MDLQYQKADNLEFQEIGDEVLVHDPASEKIHVLNKAAAKILRLCDGSPADKLVDALMPSEDFDRTRVQNDVNKIVEHFLNLGLVKTVASSERTLR